MIVYHGTTLEIQQPEIIRSEVGRDFGFAFYTTDIKEQAERWAIRRKRMAERKKASAYAVVNVYEWCSKQELSVKKFDTASIEWLDMVVKCRSDIEYKHSYDIVIGKIANDNVGETVSYVVRGVMRREDAVERLRFERINNQIAFCTERSLTELKFMKSYIVEG